MSALLDSLCGTTRLQLIAANETAMGIVHCEPVVTHDCDGFTVSEWVPLEPSDEVTQ